MCSSNAISVAASLCLTASLIAVGMAFFGPYWLSNVSSAWDPNEKNFTGNQMYLNITAYNDLDYNYRFLYPDRGLWAQCGVDCQWFWENDYSLQKIVLTPLKWHLATQVLYFVAATIVLFGEIFARLQLCCSPKKVVFLALGISLLSSALIQVGALATFGGGATRWPYNAMTDPTKYTTYLGQNIQNYYNFDVSPSPNPLATLYPTYLGWCYWIAVVGSMLTTISGSLFLVASFLDRQNDKANY